MNVAWESVPPLPLAHAATLVALARQRIAADVRLAIAQVPRHEYVPRSLWRLGYADVDLWQFGVGPSVRSVAALLDAAAVQPHETCVELGTGSGWTAAVLSHLCADVRTVRGEGSAVAPALARTYARVVAVGDPAAAAQLVGDADVVLTAFAPPVVPSAVLRALRPGARLVVAAGSAPQLVMTLENSEDGVVVTRHGTIRLGAWHDLDGALNLAATVPAPEGAES